MASLGSRAELVQYLHAHHRDVVSSPQLVRFSYDHDGESVTVTFNIVRSVRHREWVALWVVIGPSQQYRPREVLRLNPTLPIGTLAVYENTLVLRQLFSLHGLRPASFEHGLSAMVAVAIGLRARRAPYTSSPIYR